MYLDLLGTTRSDITEDLRVWEGTMGNNSSDETPQDKALKVIHKIFLKATVSQGKKARIGGLSS